MRHPEYCYTETGDVIVGKSLSYCPDTGSQIECNVQRVGDLIGIEINVLLMGSFDEFKKTKTGSIFADMKEGAFTVIEKDKK